MRVKRIGITERTQWFLDKGPLAEGQNRLRHFWYDP